MLKLLSNDIGSWNEHSVIDSFKVSLERLVQRSHTNLDYFVKGLVWTLSFPLSFKAVIRDQQDSGSGPSSLLLMGPMLEWKTHEKQTNEKRFSYSPLPVPIRGRTDEAAIENKREKEKVKEKKREKEKEKEKKREKEKEKEKEKETERKKEKESEKEKEREKETEREKERESEKEKETEKENEEKEKEKGKGKGEEKEKEKKEPKKKEPVFFDLSRSKVIVTLKVCFFMMYFPFFYSLFTFVCLLS